MKLLAIGHSLVIDSNRQFWSAFAQLNKATVDVVCPSRWSSNLSAHIEYRHSSTSDTHLRTVYPVRVFYSGNGSLFFFNPLQLRRILRQQKYDAIYLNQEAWALATLTFLLARCFTPNHSTPLLLCVAQNLRKSKLRVLHPYERFIARFVKAFLYCSDGVADVLRWKGITTPSYYFPLPYSDDNYRPSLSTPQTPFRLGYLGRLTEDKGLRVVLRALDELNQEGIHYRFIVGGNGPLRDEVCRRSYVDYKGLIPHNQAQEFYQNIDCFVLASQTRPHWKEQFGRVIVESFAAGKPVIGSRSGSIPEVLGKLEWPWLFPEDSAEELKRQVKAMEAYLRTAAGQQQLQHSIERNKMCFSQSAVARQLFKDFQEVTAASL